MAIKSREIHKAADACRHSSATKDVISIVGQLGGEETEILVTLKFFLSHSIDQVRKMM